MFALHDLTDMMTEEFEQRDFQNMISRTRLKERIFEHFPDLTEEKETRDRVFPEANHSPESRKFKAKQFWIMTQLSVSNDIFTMVVKNHLFQLGLSIFSSTSFRAQIIAFARQFQEDSSMCHLAMLNMTYLSTNLKCETPLAMFLALKLHSQTMSKIIWYNYFMSIV